MGNRKKSLMKIYDFVNVYSVAREGESESVAEHMKFKKFETRALCVASRHSLFIKNDENKKANLCAPSAVECLSSGFETHFP